MKILYLLPFLCDYVFAVIYVRNTDTNKTVAVLDDIEFTYGISFGEADRAYLFESKPPLACEGSIDPPFAVSNVTNMKLVALIRRGVCTFQQKISAAQNSGYMGVIIYNNVSGYISPKISDYPPDDISIPSLMVSFENGCLLNSTYTFTKSRQNFILIFYENPNFNPQYYIIAFLGFVSLGFFIIGIGFGIKLCHDAIKRRANRLRKCHLKKIPIKKFVKGQDPYETCAICLDDFKNGDKLRILPCNHAYHSMCIDPWLLQQKRNCPICKCRIKIPGRDEDLDSVEGTSPDNNPAVINEQTPLINSIIPNLSTYLSNNEADVQFIPQQHSQTRKNCYENLSFGIGGESEQGTSCDIESNSTVNTTDSTVVAVEHANIEPKSDLTKII